MHQGVAWLKRFVTLEEQQMLVARCRDLIDGPAGGYVPTVRGGGRMHVRMLCLGRHWNPPPYRSEATREDFDQQPVPPVPGAWVQLASRAAGEAGFDTPPDLCILNYYPAARRMAGS